MKDHHTRTSRSATTRRFVAGAIADHRGVRAGPLAITIETAGERPDPGSPTAEQVRLVSIEDSPSPKPGDEELPGVVLPAMVNAHTHLDLTCLGPRPFDQPGGFAGWLEMIRTGRPGTDAEIRTSVERGAELSRRGGVAAVGDIAGARAGPTPEPWRAARAAGLVGVSFAEFFAIGAGEAAGLDRLRAFVAEHASDLAEQRVGQDAGRMRLGLQPHAPYSVGLAGYRAAVELAGAHGLPLSTHLAETMDERLLVFDAIGPKRAMLDRLGLWTDDLLDEFGQARHPVEHLEAVLDGAGFLCAHVADADRRVIATLARTRAHVAYCPRASAYFNTEAELGPHRYREMLAAGVNVCLGTDSIVNLDTPDRIGVLDEMRLLRRRDGTDPLTLLAMGTVRGARALGLDERLFEWTPGSDLLGLVEVPIGPGAKAGTDPLEAALDSDEGPRPIVMMRGRA